jgi:inorganic triphosphatase YgiF
MEIEAKFAVPDTRTFQRLLAAETLAGMSLLPGLTQAIHDRYLDTREQAIRRGGYACRLRQRGDERLVTFKSLHGTLHVGGVKGAIHQRAEHETALPPGATTDPATWPAGPARALAVELSQGQPILPLFDLHQTRHIRTLADGDRVVAEVSLDDVRVGEISYFELEIELMLGGTMNDLRRAVDELATKWDLVPEPHSKFERALATLNDKPNESRSV